MKLRQILLFFFLLSACGSENKNNNDQKVLDEFNQSFDTYKRLKATHSGYEYLCRYSQGPIWSPGTYGITTIQIKGDLPSVRSFKNKGKSDPAYPDYMETGAQIGSNNYGCAPQTVDDLYNECKSKILSKLGNFQYEKFRFETDNEGIMKRCSCSKVAPKEKGRYADGGSEGEWVNVDSFKWN
jgi:hypothetical protein